MKSAKKSSTIRDYQQVGEVSPFSTIINIKNITYKKAKYGGNQK